MKNLLLIIAFLITSSLHSQFIIKDGHCTGVGPFELDDTLSKFSSLRFESASPGNSEPKRTAYSYSGADALLLKIFGESFNSVFLSFNGSNKLTYIFLSKTYYKKDTRKFRKAGRRLYKNLIRAAIDQLNNKGEEGKPPSNKKYTSKEWVWFDEFPEKKKYSWLRIEYDDAKGRYATIGVYFGYRGN